VIDRAGDFSTSRGPHTHRVARVVGHWLDRYAARGSRITVACSGGADSLALAVVTLGEAERQGHPTAAVTVDHGLQHGSAERATKVAETLRSVGYSDVRVLTVQVGKAGGVESAARQARYNALFPQAGGGAILLGHTLDDQAETVLLGLSRGSGPRSIAGMAEFTPPYGRPLLGIRRSETEAVCAEAGLTPWDDPHNADPAFTRVRIRHEVLPLLDEVVGGGVAAALARTATQLQEDGEVLDGLATELLGSALDGASLLIDVLAHRPVALRRRVLRAWLLTAGVTGLTADHLVRLDRLVTNPGGTAAVRLPGHLDATVDRGPDRAGKALLRLVPAR
jgi:tRNA(Ile)-lysidine synthase